MANITYSVENVTVSVLPQSEYATVCWTGVIRASGDDCNPPAVSKSVYCQDVYVGENTDCGGGKKTISGSFTWNGETINYTIEQDNDPGDNDCTECKFGSPHCEFISVSTIPYYVTRDVDSVIVTMEWYEIAEDNCGNVSRTRKKESEKVTVGGWPDCLEENKVVTGTLKRCSSDFNYEYVMVADKSCCPEDGITCEIGEVYYDVIGIPYPVSESGQYEINYYFDYKKTETKDCVSKTEYLRYSGVWTIDYSDVLDDECHSKTITGSIENPCLCDGCEDITLSIIRSKNHAAEDCTEECEPGDYKCVDISSIKYFIRSDCRDWEYGDERPENYEDEGCPWEEMPEGYKVKWYGEEIKATWTYTRYVIYDDCSVAITPDNTYEYIFMAPPFSDTNIEDGGNNDGVAPQNECTEEEVSMLIDFGDVPTDEHIQFLKEYDKENPHNIEKNCGIFNLCYQQEETPDGCERCVDSSEIDLDESGTRYINGDPDPCDSYSLESECEVDLYFKPDWVKAEKDPSRPKNGCKIRYSAEENKYEDREGSVIWHIVGTDCYDTVRITQKGKGEDRTNDEFDEDNPEGSCDCDSMGAYPVTTKIPSDGGNNIKIGTYIYDSCLTSVSASGGFTASDGVISGRIPKNEKCVDVTHSTTVTFKCEGGDTKQVTITVTQEAGGIPALEAEGKADCCEGGTITIKFKT